MKIKYFFRGFKEGQKKFGGTIAVIVNSVLLSLVYFIGFGLTSLIGKISGKHFLQLNGDKNKTSYWTDLNLNKKPIREYYRQF